MRHSLSAKIRRSLQWRGLSGSLRHALSNGSAIFDLPTLLFSHRRPGAPNRLELRVFAPRRSGHHAIMHWITSNIEGRVVFLNDCRPKANPFVYARGTHIHDGRLNHRFLFRDREAAGRFSKKGTLIDNYENFEFYDEVMALLDPGRHVWVGESERFHDVLILRDPFNLLASRLRSSRALGRAPDQPLAKARRIWKPCAREFAGQTHYATRPVFISYNAWFTSPEYREDLARQLGLPSADKGLDRVAPYGPAAWGGSFDGLAFDGKASQMKVLDRWREYQDDPAFRAQFQDDDLWTLSERIFGHLPDTELLRDASVVG